jgi:hypothetical protein
MLFKGKIGVPLQMSGQPLPQRLAFHGRPSWDLVDGNVAREAPPFEPSLMVEREIPKRSWTSFLGIPWSKAASAFNLRSFE